MGSSKGHKAGSRGSMRTETEQARCTAHAKPAPSFASTCCQWLLLPCRCWSMGMLLWTPCFSR